MVLSRVEYVPLIAVLTLIGMQLMNRLGLD